MNKYRIGRETVNGKIAATGTGTGKLTGTGPETKSVTRT